MARCILETEHKQPGLSLEKVNRERLYVIFLTVLKIYQNQAIIFDV